jgi:peptidoglycan/LPS O-acetylase OafA/YrhL
MSVMLTGVLVAYIAVQVRSRQPRVTGKSLVITSLMHFIGVMILLLIVLLPSDNARRFERWSDWGNAVYLYSSHVGWGIGLSLLILPSIINPAQTLIVTQITDWSGWQILGKLTFGVYLLHCLLVHMFYDNYIVLV